MSPSEAPDDPESANGLLAALPAGDRADLQPYLESVAFPARTVLHQAGELISHVYFPTVGVVSILAVPPDGDGVEAGVVGREGFAGLPVLLGTDRSPSRCVVQIPVEALQMKAEDFRSRLVQSPSLQALLLRYSHFFLCQVSQSLACGAAHPIEQRLCRWLLLMHDRADADQFPLTQEFVANMLGVRRASVSEVSGALQERGLITYRRGRISVLDRPGLEQASCDCFRVVQAEWRRLFA